MSRQLTYAFQELPLVIANGFQAGLVNGQAIITYWLDGQWGVTEIYLDGHRDRTERERDADRAKGLKLIPRFENKAVALDGDPLFTIIWSRLEDEWRGFVQAAVNNAIEQEREAVHA
jgi:hypothetical protein